MFGPLAFDVPRGFSYNIETDSRYPSCAGMMLTEAAPGSSRLAPAPEVFRIADYFGKLDLEPNPFPVVVSYSGTSVSKTSAEAVSLRLSSILALAKSDSKVTVESGKVTISPPTPVLVVRAAAKTLGPGTYLLRLTYTALNDAGANISGLESLYVVLSNGSTLEIGVTEYRDGLTHERAASLLDEIAANIRLT